MAFGCDATDTTQVITWKFPLPALPRDVGKAAGIASIFNAIREKEKNNENHHFQWMKESYLTNKIFFGSEKPKIHYFQSLNKI